MKKKIKDLTLIEANNYCHSKSCVENCPFLFDKKNCLLYFFTSSWKDELVKETLEKEVEINESDNEKY